MTLWGCCTGWKGWETQQNSDPSTISVCILYCWPGVLQCLVILWVPTCKFTHEQSKTKRLQRKPERSLSTVRRSRYMRHIRICGWSPEFTVHHVHANFKRAHSLCKTLNLMDTSSYWPLPKHAMYMTQSSTKGEMSAQESRSFIFRARRCQFLALHIIQLCRN